MAKLRAKLVAGSNARMAAAKITVTKVVKKSQQVGPVQRPLTASFVGSRVLHKEVKDVEDVKKADDVSEDVEVIEDVKKAEDVKEAEVVKNDNFVKNQMT